MGFESIEALGHKRGGERLAPFAGVFDFARHHLQWRRFHPASHHTGGSGVVGIDINDHRISYSAFFRAVKQVLRLHLGRNSGPRLPHGGSLNPPTGDARSHRDSTPSGGSRQHRSQRLTSHERPAPGLGRFHVMPSRAGPSAVRSNTAG